MGNSDNNATVISLQRKIKEAVEALSSLTVSTGLEVTGAIASVENLVTTQMLTGAWNDAGSAIDTSAYNRVGIYVTCDTNDSRSIALRVLGLHTVGGTEFTVDGISTKTIVDAVSTADINIYYEFDVGTISYIQIQLYAGTVGATPGTITIDVDKRWRN